MIKLRVPFYENNFLIWYRSKLCTFIEKTFIKTKQRSGYVSGIGSTIQFCLESLGFLLPKTVLGRVWREQRGNQNP
jgi:hypothetical protein